MRAAVPERVAMQLTGHKTRAVFERYNIVSAGDLLDAARRLDTYVSVRLRNPSHAEQRAVSCRISDVIGCPTS